MDLGLSGARALVCGGSAGLGAAVAAALAAEGARVAIAARPGERLTKTAGSIGALAIPVDLASQGGPAHAVAAAVAELGGLDALLVNMGGPPPGKFADLDDAAWQKALDMTLWSTLRLLRAALPALAESAAAGGSGGAAGGSGGAAGGSGGAAGGSGGAAGPVGAHGSICVILSSSVREPIPALTTSNLLRPGLVGLIKSLVAEIAPVRINGIAPGRVATDRIATLDEGRAQSAGVSVPEIQQQNIARIPLARYGDPAEVGRVAAFLLSPAASYVTGAIVPVDGGMVRALP